MPEETELEQYLDEGHSHIALGELDEAAAAFRRCTELDPDYFEGWHALGMALMKLERYPEAIEAGLRAVELSPNDQLAWSSLSMFYVKNRQIPEAEAAGAKARIISWGGKVKKET